MWSLISSLKGETTIYYILGCVYVALTIGSISYDNTILMPSGYAVTSLVWAVLKVAVVLIYIYKQNMVLFWKSLNREERLI